MKEFFFSKTYIHAWLRVYVYVLVYVFSSCRFQRMKGFPTVQDDFRSSTILPTTLHIFRCPLFVFFQSFLPFLSLPVPEVYLQIKEKLKELFGCDTGVPYFFFFFFTDHERSVFFIRTCAGAALFRAENTKTFWRERIRLGKSGRARILWLAVASPSLNWRWSNYLTRA